MALPTPRTWTVGELCTAAKLNTDLRDGLTYLLAPPLAHLTKSAAQSIPTGVDTAVTWDTEDIDRDGGHSTGTNPSRYTAQTAGWYKMSANLAWASVTGSWRMSFAKKNNAGTNPFRDIMVPTSTGNLASNSVDARFFLAVSDYVEIFARQDTGSAQNVFSNSTGDGGGWTVQWISM